MWLFAILLLRAGGVFAEGAPPTNVLVVFSYQQDAALYHTLDERLLEVLQSDTPRVNSYVEYLDTLEFDSPAQQQRTVAYLHDKYADLNIHLLVAVTPLALDFILANRDRLLPDVPIVFTSVNERRARQAAHEPNLTGVGVTHDPAATVEIALKLHPDAVNMVIPAGSSAIERTWTDATRESLRPFERRIHITFLTDLTLAELEQRLRSLPAHTIVLFADLFYHDASGQYYLPEESLRRICLNANAPVYGLMASDMGFGIVGGSLYDMGEAGAAAGRLARRVLAGERASDIPLQVLNADHPMFDARQLQRWHVDGSLLPQGSDLRFREPGLWEMYRRTVVVVGTVLLAQSLFIWTLWHQRRRLRESERGFRAMAERNQDLAGHLISAQEAERTRIARDLHDDVSQQLAVVGMILNELQRDIGGTVAKPQIDQTVGTLVERNVAVMQSVRNISHKLHSDMLRHSGLVAGLGRHFAEVAQHHQLEVSFDAAGDVDSLSPDIVLCLFRVAQEALTNVIRHARARHVTVTLAATPEQVDLRIADDGVGFDADDPAGRGLGLRSIDERVRLVRGSCRVESQPGRGATLHVWLPRSTQPL
jgi:signal transduction histidine kinase